MSTYKTTFRKSVGLMVGEFLHPLRDMGITQFSHSMTFGNNQISALGSSTEVSTYFNKHKIPPYCCDEYGRILDDGIYTNRILAAMHPDFAKIWPVLSDVGKKFNLNYGKNSLHIMQRSADCQHLFTFHFDLYENEFLRWSLNNGQFIYDTLETYRLSGNDLIIEAKDTKNRSTRDKLAEFNYSKYLNKHSKTNCIKLLHKSLNIPIHLSPQQSKCLLLHVSGKSAKQISSEMNISPRTVESYLEIIKSMVGCSTGKELIAVYYNSQILNDNAKE